MAPEDVRRNTEVNWDERNPSCVELSSSQGRLKNSGRWDTIANR